MALEKHMKGHSRQNRTLPRPYGTWRLWPTNRAMRKRQRFCTPKRYRRSRIGMTRGFGWDTGNFNSRSTTAALKRFKTASDGGPTGRKLTQSGHRLLAQGRAGACEQSTGEGAFVTAEVGRYPARLDIAHDRDERSGQGRCLPVEAQSARGSFSELSYNLGVALQVAKRLEDAANAYSHALQTKPDFAEANLNLGHILKALGKETEARACWDKALAIKPELIQ